MMRLCTAVPARSHAGISRTGRRCLRRGGWRRACRGQCPCAKASGDTSSPQVRAAGGLPPEARRAKGGAGSGNRTRILSLEGSRHTPQAHDFKQTCATIPGMFTPNTFNGLQLDVHRFCALKKQANAAGAACHPFPWRPSMKLEEKIAEMLRAAAGWRGAVGVLRRKRKLAHGDEPRRQPSPRV